MTFKFTPRTLAIAAGMIFTLGFSPTTTFAQGTAFTYQGRLDAAGSPANGIYDLQFALFDAASGGTQQSGTWTQLTQGVTNGLFTVELDFGSFFPGAARWLEIGVRTNGTGAFTTLAPRQALTPTPYAIQAGHATLAAAAKSVAATNIVGTLPLGQLPANLVTDGATNVNLSGAFTGNGVGLTGVGQWNVNSQGAVRFKTNFLFLLNSSPLVGNNYDFVTAADVNGDGWPDLISSSRSSSTLAVLTNNRSGGFALAASPIVGTSPYFVKAADVNGDGKPDLISANYGNSTLTVLTNSGVGDFAVAASPAVGFGPWSVTAADVSGDGWMDLISADSSSFTLTVLTNDRSGGFVAAATLGVGAGPLSVIPVDVNLDSRPDLISANFTAGTLTIFTNNGSGALVVSATPVLNQGIRLVTSADVNGDGWPDLMTANSISSSLTVLTNNRSGGFLVSAVHVVGGAPRTLTTADVNGDGWSDIISANSEASALTVLTNNRSGGFALAASPAVGPSPFSIVTADVNGDGRPDMITANAGVTDKLTVLVNTATFDSPAFTGDGSGLTNLNAASLTGTLVDARLSANVSLMGPAIESSEITDGTIVNADLSPSAGIEDTKLNTISTAGKVANSATTASSANVGNAIVVRDSSGNFAAGAITGITVSGNGAGLTSIPAASLTGTVPDARLSANVALRAGGNAFTGNQTISSGSLGIGIAPQSTLDVNGTARIDGANNWNVTGSEGDFRVGNDSFRFKIGVSTGGGGAGDVWMRAHGGTARVFIKTPGGTTFFSNEGETLGVSLAANGTSWASISDRNVKKDFASVDSVQILEKLAAMPITKWHYQWEDSDVTPHIGPMAQDFKAAFYPGADDKSITTQEADGVALAAIQGLNQKLEEQRAANAELKQELAELKQLIQTLVPKR